MPSPRLLLLLLALGAAQAAEPVRYTVRFPEVDNHYAEVEAIIPTGGAAKLELMMAVWTPGSYKLREYARHTELVQVGGRTLTKVAKNRWVVDTGGKGSVKLGYRLYGRLMTVRTNWIERDFALINGAATFITRRELLASPHEVRFVMPKGWSRAVTGLKRVGSKTGWSFRAPDFDRLVDSPVLLGDPKVHRFVAGGKAHELATIGHDGVWDTLKAARDLEKLVAKQIEFWGSAPYERYSFLNLLTQTGGGLEHLNSTVIMGNRWNQSVREDYVDWLRLCSHEFFHTWNVKRLRPVELGPFEYERETHTRALWIAEGITSYYDGLLVRRAGLVSRKEYLGLLSKRVGRTEQTPGRGVRSLEQSSYDAWIKHYLPDENQANSTVSYYTVGAALAFVLDARVRQATKGSKSLDDVMKAAYAKYSGERGYTPEEFYAVASEVAGEDLSGFFARYAQSASRFDYGPAMKWYGLRFADPPKKAKAWLGARFKGAHVRSVLRGSPAFRAGLNAGDELIAIDRHRVAAGQLEKRLKHYRPEQTVTLLVSRRETLMKLPLRLGADPKGRYKVELDPKATKLQQARLEAWIGK